MLTATLFAIYLLIGVTVVVAKNRAEDKRAALVRETIRPLLAHVHDDPPGPRQGLASHLIQAVFWPSVLLALFHAVAFFVRHGFLSHQTHLISVDRLSLDRITKVEFDDKPPPDRWHRFARRVRASTYARIAYFEARPWYRPTGRAVAGYVLLEHPEFWLTERLTTTAFILERPGGLCIPLSSAAGDMPKRSRYT